VKQLVLFDFDGTITKEDSLKKFLFYYRGRLRVILGLLVLSPVLALYLSKLLSNHFAKQIVLRYFFGKESAGVFNKKCTDFALQKIPLLVRQDALAKIMEHVKNQDTVVVVSASPENWVKPWSNQLGLLCIATKLEVKENRITGSYSGNNCYGPEKVRRIKEEIDLTQFQKITAYGDSRGDREMLAMADNKNYRLFQAT
jgi:phosphatidylglycerophosphatase C